MRKPIIFAGSSILLLIIMWAVLDYHSVGVTSLITPAGPPQGIVMIDKGFLKQELGWDYLVHADMTGALDALNNPSADNAAGWKQVIDDVPSGEMAQLAADMEKQKYQFIYCNYEAFIEYVSRTGDFGRGSNYVAIANASNGQGPNLIARPNIKDINQLAGKTVGIINHDYATLLILANTLKENGLDIKARGGSVNVKFGSSADISREFRDGKIDAFMARKSYRGYGFQWVLRENTEMAYSGAPYQVLLVRKSLFKTRPDIVEKILKAHIKATAWIQKHPQATSDIVWTQSGKYYKARAVGSSIAPKASMDRAYRKMKVDVYPNTRFIRDIWGYMEQYNAVTPYPYNSVVDFRPLNEVLKKQGLSTIEEQEKNYNG